MIASGAGVVMIQESAPLGPHIDRIKQTYPYRLGCGAQTITCDQSLWSKTPMYVSTQRGLWAIQEGHATLLERPKTGQ